MAVPMKITVFWDVMICNLVDSYQHSQGICCLLPYSSSLKMGALSSSKMLTLIYQTMWHYIPECGLNCHIVIGMTDFQFICLRGGCTDDFFSRRSSVS
jgi:hypothetical protein